MLTLLALGHTNAEIGAQLHLSVRTVEATARTCSASCAARAAPSSCAMRLDHGLLDPAARS